jgi:hypothetical protein
MFPQSKCLSRAIKFVLIITVNLWYTYKKSTFGIFYGKVQPCADVLRHNDNY